jgi:hypothetical protein
MTILPKERAPGGRAAKEKNVSDGNVKGRQRAAKKEAATMRQCPP